MPAYVMTVDIAGETFRITHDGPDRTNGGPYIATSTTRTLRAHSLDQLTARLWA